jgi:hypothetical protein
MTRTIQRNAIKIQLGTNDISAAWRRFQNTRYGQIEYGLSLLGRFRRLCSSVAVKVKKRVKKFRNKQSKASRMLNRK